MKKVLILGVNGFIGHHLSRRILETTDWHVYGMDMMSDRITELLDNEAFKPRLHFFEGDIMINKEWVEYHVKKCDVILPLVAIATPSTYVKEPLRVFELDFEANLQIVRAAVVQQGLPGISVAVGVNGEVVWAEGFGWTDFEDNAVVGPDTRFRIGTASKVLTSAAAGLLIEQGKRRLISVAMRSGPKCIPRADA